MSEIPRGGRDKIIATAALATILLSGCSEPRKEQKTTPTPYISVPYIGAPCPARALPNLKPEVTTKNGTPEALTKDGNPVFSFVATQACKKVVTFAVSKPYPSHAVGEVTAGELFAVKCRTDDHPVEAQIVSLARPEELREPMLVLLDGPAFDVAKAQNIPICLPATPDGAAA